jgi:hypothetical protein
VCASPTQVTLVWYTDLRWIQSGYRTSLLTKVSVIYIRSDLSLYILSLELSFLPSILLSSSCLFPQADPQCTVWQSKPEFQQLDRRPTSSRISRPKPFFTSCSVVNTNIRFTCRVNSVEKPHQRLELAGLKVHSELSRSRPID